MPKYKSNRRSMSVKGITYQRLKNFCDRHGKSMSGYLEEKITEHMDDVGEPVPERLERPKSRPAGDVDKIIGQYFTF